LLYWTKRRAHKLIFVLTLARREEATSNELLQGVGAESTLFAHTSARLSTSVFVMSRMGQRIAKLTFDTLNAVKIIASITVAHEVYFVTCLIEPSGKNSRNFHTLGYEMGNFQKLVFFHTQMVLFQTINFF
jgi:hypothetical protein